MSLELRDILNTPGAIRSAKLGGVFNHTEVEEDGTVKSRGDATVWEDIQASLIGRRLFSNIGTIDYYYEENALRMDHDGDINDQNDRIIFSKQKPHGAADDSPFNLHIHWEQTDAVSREFTIQYRLQDNGVAKTVAWTEVIVDTNTNNIYPYTSGTLNQITNLVSIDTTGHSLSTVLQVRLTRSDSVAGNIFATFVDAHVKMDMNGSAEEYVK